MLTKRSPNSDSVRYFDNNASLDPPTVSYEAVMRSDDGVKKWTGGFWRFTADLASKDSAYTQAALAAHTDTTYFTDPAGLQTFHLHSHTNGNGGASLLVDGFAVAERLRTESLEAFQDLCRIKIRGHSSGNEGIAIMPVHSFPVISVEDTESGKRGRVTQIRWNNDDRAAMMGLKSEDISKFYAAARKWVEILRRPESECWVQLTPGKVLTNMDDFISRWKTLHVPKKTWLQCI
ncbi:MAG: hypothetical protein Q9218_007685 [Villophora microphyllina]